MKTDKKQPIWVQIHAALFHDIASGVYAMGQKMPTEAALAKRFDANRHTIRRALAELQNQGHIHVRQGSGAFVSHAPFDYRLGKKTRFSQNLAGTGLQTGREVLRLETLAASDKAIKHLQIPRGSKVHILEIVSLVDGAPFSYSRSMFPANRLPDLLDALREHDSITAALAANGVTDYSRAWTRLSAKSATGMIARVLCLPERSPVLRSVSLNIDTDQLPVEYGRTWFHGERAQIVVEGDTYPDIPRVFDYPKKCLTF